MNKTLIQNTIEEKIMSNTENLLEMLLSEKTVTAQMMTNENLYVTVIEFVKDTTYKMTFKSNTYKPEIEYIDIADCENDVILEQISQLEIVR